MVYYIDHVFTFLRLRGEGKDGKKGVSSRSVNRTSERLFGGGCMDSAELSIGDLYILMDEASRNGENPNEVFNDCLTAICKALNAERGFIMIYESEFREMMVYATYNLDPITLFTTAEVSQTVIDSVARDCIPILSTNALDDPRFKDKSSVVISGLRSVLCVPITLETGLLGLIYLDNRMKIGAYLKEHLDFLNEVAVRLSEIIVRIFPHAKAKPRFL
jgi:signal transduction protein with GAF and PtsI domain